MGRKAVVCRCYCSLMISNSRGFAVMPQYFLFYRSFYDANARDAFVLPRPSADHVRLNNSSNLPVTDVVVDPAIARCLRPHQKTGKEI